MNDGLTGYPSIDKPWLKHYDKESLARASHAAKRTVWQEVRENNSDFEGGTAIEFFGAHITFKRLFDSVERCASALAASGVSKGDVVTIVSAGTPEFVYLFYAISKIGAVANLMAPHFDAGGMEATIRDCSSRMAFVMDEFYTQVEPVLRNASVEEVVILPLLASSPLRFVPKRRKKVDCDATKWTDFQKRGDRNECIASVSYEEGMPFVIVYSSGSTGASKGILLSQDSFQNSIHAYAGVGVEVSRGKKLYQIIPPWFSTGVSTSIHLPLSFGATVFMDPRFDRKVFVKNVLRAKPNYTVGPTTVYEGFVSEPIPHGADLSFLEAPFEGGETLPSAMASAINDALRQHGCPVGLLTGYGQCECGATVTTMVKGTPHPVGSVGIPLPGVNVMVVDDGFRELGAGERGHIVVDTPCGMLRYFKDPDATSQFFYEDANGTRWSRTGDIGYLDLDGNLFVEGRASDVVKIDGEDWFCFDIEKAFMDSGLFESVDLLEGTLPGGDEGIVAHVILSDAGHAIEGTRLRDSFGSVRREVASRLGLPSDFVQYFKVWDIFPQAKSGKRDCERMRSDLSDAVFVE